MYEVWLIAFYFFALSTMVSVADGYSPAHEPAAGLRPLVAGSPFFVHQVSTAWGDDGHRGGERGGGSEVPGARGLVAMKGGPPKSEEAGGHDEGPALNPLEFRTDLALWTAVVFLVLLAILGPLAWSPIARALDRRERHLEEQFAEAKRRLERAEVLLREHERRLATAGEEAERILQRAIEEAQQRAGEILAQARAEAETEHKRRLADLERAADEALRQLVERAAVLAAEIAARLMRSHLDPASHRRLLEDALSQLAHVGASLAESDLQFGERDLKSPN